MNFHGSKLLVWVASTNIVCIPIDCAAQSMRTPYLHVHDFLWYWLKMQCYNTLTMSIFKKIPVTKLYKIGPVPTSNFILKICTNFIHLPDYDRLWADLSIDTFSLFVWSLTTAICIGWDQITARIFWCEWRRLGQHLVPFISARMLFSCMRTPDVESAYWNRHPENTLPWKPPIYKASLLQGASKKLKFEN